jgi:hypothetical protein
VPPNRLHRLAEILGARKILLGTVVNKASLTSSDTVATSTGLLGALLGEGLSLLGADELAELESIEQRVFSNKHDDQVPTEELYQVITRMINEIHSRIAIALVEDMRSPHWVGSFPTPRLLSVGKRSRRGTRELDAKDVPFVPPPIIEGDDFAEAKTASKEVRQETLSGCRSGVKWLLLWLAARL